MRKFCAAVLPLLLCILLTGCCMSHEWKEASCSAPKTCTKCGATEGEPLPHTWQEATCQSLRTCTVCQATEGSLGEHTWQDATCVSPKTCALCGATEGEPLPHTWAEATLDAPKTCTLCGETEGTAANFFAINGLEVLEGLPEEVDSTAALINGTNEAKQEIVPAQYRDFSSSVQTKADGSKRVSVDFSVSFSYRVGGSMGFNQSIVDYNFFDLYTGKLIPLEGGCKVELEDVTYEIGVTGNAYGNAGEDSTLEDGSTATPYTLNLRFDLDIPEGYDGLVLAIADLKHYGLRDTQWKNGLVKGMHANEFAQYADYYEGVRFFHIPVA